jgi:GT2 family glycosyltransferase
MRRPELSIVVLTFNRADLTRGLLASLERTAPDDAEILLVDNASTDDTPAELSAFARRDARARTLLLPRNVGYSAANNIGAREARGQVLVFLNQDMVALPGCFEPYRLLREESRLGIVGIKLVYPDDRIQHAGIELHACGIPVHRHAGVENGRDGETVPLNLAGITGACLGIRGDLFESLGGFDEGCRLLYQDVDLCLGAVAAGFDVRYDPRGLMYHLESASSSHLRTPELVRFDWSRFTGRWKAFFADAANAFGRQVRPSLDGRRLVIWGTGRFAELVAGGLASLDIDVDGFVDSGPDTRDREFLGRPVTGPAEIAGRPEVRILVASGRRASIAATAERFGLGNRIVDTALPTSTVYELLRARTAARAG